MLRTARSTNALLCFIAILGIGFVAAAQSPIDEDWHQWSSDVCLKILTASPWVTTAQPENPKNVRRAALLSSILVREAMLRQLQIRKKYDTMPPSKRKEFDEQTATCLTDPRYTTYIVLRVWGGPPVNPKRADGIGQLSILEHSTSVGPNDNYDIPLTCGGDSFPWQHVPTANDKDADYMNRNDPNQAGLPDDRLRSMDFLYPRSFDGKSLIQPGDRTMVFNWGDKGGRFTFHLADLIYKDKLDF